MSRLANKSLTARAPQTAAAVPELPDFDAELAALPGGQKTNAAMQRWWDLVRQRIEFTNGDNNSRFRQVSASINGLTASVTEIIEVVATQDEYLEASWTIQAAAGPIVTGMKLFSASGPDTEVSYIAFQADRFQVNTATGGNKVIFSATSSAVKLGDVLTVDLVNAKVFIGTGTYGNANTAFYVDDDGYFSLKNKLTFDPTGAGTLSVTGTIVAGAGEIGGWTINATTIARNNAILDSAGQLILGTSNDVVYISATDSTYRVWIGNATAGSASFRVTKTGTMTAVNGVFSGAVVSTSGAIGGLTIAATTLSAGSNATYVELSSLGTAGLQVGTGTSSRAFIRTAAGGFTGVFVTNNLGNVIGRLVIDDTNGDSSLLVGGGASFSSENVRILGATSQITFGNSNDTNLYRSAANTLKTDDAFQAASLATAYFESGVTTAVDIKDVHLRIYDGASQTARIDHITGFYHVQGNQVVGARGTKGAGTITEVVALLDAWGAWA